jgi:hypothetical protein
MRRLAASYPPLQLTGGNMNRIARPAIVVLLLASALFAGQHSAYEKEVGRWKMLTGNM